MSWATTMQSLIDGWRREADALDRKSRETYKKLGAGELAQVDEIVYSVFEDNGRAQAMRRCAIELEKVSHRLGQQGG